jgi:type I restriction enzyme M protein
LLQCLCDGVFRSAKETGYRSITLNHVNEAAEALIRDNGHFADLFRYAGSDRRRLILAFCHRESRGPDALRMGMIQEKLSAFGIDVRDEQLAADLEWLTDFELLSFAGAAGGETYSLAVPLMGTWIDTRDYAALLTKARSETEEDDHD